MPDVLWAMQTHIHGWRGRCFGGGQTFFELFYFVQPVILREFIDFMIVVADFLQDVGYVVENRAGRDVQD